jgi:hypothetical protein
MAPSTAVWKKRVLIPFWFCRIIFMLVIIGVYAWAIHYTQTDRDIESVALGVIVVFMLLLVICLLLDILAIVMFARGALRAGAFLMFNCVQTGIWLVVVVLEIAAIARKNTNKSGLIGSFIVLYAFVSRPGSPGYIANPISASFLGLLIYAIIQFRREKANMKRGHGETLNPAANPASVPLVQSQPQQYGYAPTSGFAPSAQPTHYQPAQQMPALLPAHVPAHIQPQGAVRPHGEANEYYAGAPIPSAHSQSAANPFLDPPILVQKH